MLKKHTVKDMHCSSEDYRINQGDTESTANSVLNNFVCATECDLKRLGFELSIYNKTEAILFQSLITDSPKKSPLYIMPSNGLNKSL